MRFGKFRAASGYTVKLPDLFFSRHGSGIFGTTRRSACAQRREIIA